MNMESYDDNFLSGEMNMTPDDEKPQSSGEKLEIPAPNQGETCSKTNCDDTQAKGKQNREVGERTEYGAVSLRIVFPKMRV